MKRIFFTSLLAVVPVTTFLLLGIVAVYGLQSLGLIAVSPPNRAALLPTVQFSTKVAAVLTSTPLMTPTVSITLTPVKTLKPPPTFEPPTATIAPTLVPSVTPTQIIDLNVNIPGLMGAQSPTPTSTIGCKPRKDWKLVYVVQRNDALSRIADQYNTTVDTLLQANCLTNKNLIVIGQSLKVPGSVQPVVPEVSCIPFELITPLNGTQSIPNNGSLTFDWRGPRASHNLIRVTKPNNTRWEAVIDLRQNETIDLAQVFPDGGWYKWQVFPLDSSYKQVCPESPSYTFLKAP